MTSPDKSIRLDLWLGFEARSWIMFWWWPTPHIDADSHLVRCRVFSSEKCDHKDHLQIALTTASYDIYSTQFTPQSANIFLWDTVPSEN